MNYTDQAAEVIMEGLREEIEDKDKVGISEKILNEWSYEYLSPNQMNLVTFHPHNAGIHGLAELVGSEGSTKGDSELMVSWDYCCKAIGLAKEAIRLVTLIDSHRPTEGSNSRSNLLGLETSYNEAQHEDDTGIATGPGWGRPGTVPRLRTPPGARGCEESAGRRGPKQRPGSRIEGGGAGWSASPVLLLGTIPCEIDGGSELGTEDKRRKANSRGDRVMEEGCRKRTVVGTAERARGINGIDVGPNNEHYNNDYNENSGGVQHDDCIAREIEAVCP
ncbi:hypothetical protein AHAS_Ahas16G0071000 [Arachis hypogaea]